MKYTHEIVKNSDGQEVLVVKEGDTFLFSYVFDNNSMMIDDPFMSLICKNEFGRTHTSIIAADAEQYEQLRKAARIFQGVQ